MRPVINTNDVDKEYGEGPPFTAPWIGLATGQLR
jgi:hypothetical protein